MEIGTVSAVEKQLRDLEAEAAGSQRVADGEPGKWFSTEETKGWSHFFHVSSLARLSRTSLHVDGTCGNVHAVYF